MTSPPDRLGPRGKPATRRTLAARRDALTDEARAAYSALICAEAAALLAARLPPTGARVPVVALYAAKDTEVDTAPLDAALRAAGVTVAYPRVADDDRADRALAFHATAALDELAVTPRFGLREPDPARAPALALAAIDAFILPGLGFDRAGGRLGRGRGHYDATLAAAPTALRIGLAFECQLVDAVPHEPHDARLHFIITEAATHTVA